MKRIFLLITLLVFVATSVYAIQPGIIQIREADGSPSGWVFDIIVDNTALSISGNTATIDLNSDFLVQYKDGAADGDIAALNDTASDGLSDADPLVLTSGEMMGATITNLGAGAAMFFLLPPAEIGMNTIFNVDVAEDIHLIFPAGNDEGYWKDFDDTGFVLQNTGKDIQCNQGIAVGDRVFLQVRKVAATLEYFVWSDVNACIIEP
jgi:hypothetical protein